MIIPSKLNQLINSYSLAMWVLYGLVFAGLLIMRVTHRLRDVKRPFKVCIHMYIYTYLYTYVCTYIRMYVCIYVRTYILIKEVMP